LKNADTDKDNILDELHKRNDTNDNEMDLNKVKGAVENSGRWQNELEMLKMVPMLNDCSIFRLDCCKRLQNYTSGDSKTSMEKTSEWLKEKMSQGLRDLMKFLTSMGTLKNAATRTRLGVNHSIVLFVSFSLLLYMYIFAEKRF